MSVPRTYTFAADNPYAAAPDPYNTGLQHFHDGQYADAILALEAAVQRQPDHGDAWRMLGAAHAENDEDRRCVSGAGEPPAVSGGVTAVRSAIAPLLRAVEVDPGNLDSLLDLGVSYTNELVSTQALTYLREWIARHPRYQHLRVDIENEDELAATSTLHGEVTNLFMQAARLAPDDADVFTVLGAGRGHPGLLAADPLSPPRAGVLFNLSREYDRAIESFQQALQLRPDDYALWNKLGATQANSFRSLDAGAPRRRRRRRWRRWWP
jgi:peroxin-5